MRNMTTNDEIKQKVKLTLPKDLSMIIEKVLSMYSSEEVDLMLNEARADERRKVLAFLKKTYGTSPEQIGNLKDKESDSK